jgi:hypothetical protein
MARFRVSRHNRDTMPKLIAADELDALLRAVAGFPNGASVEEIRSTPGIELPKRTF